MEPTKAEKEKKQFHQQESLHMYCLGKTQVCVKLIWLWAVTLKDRWLQIWHASLPSFLACIRKKIEMESLKWANKPICYSIQHVLIPWQEFVTPWHIHLAVAQCWHDLVPSQSDVSLPNNPRNSRNWMIRRGRVGKTGIRETKYGKD